MNILFVSLVEISSIQDHGLYSDLLREFVKNGHFVSVISPVERRTGRVGEVINDGNACIIKVRIGNIQKTNYIEKSISTMLLGFQLMRAIKRYCPDMSFDLILFATPPITLHKLINKIKKASNAKTFLLLKDIWPQEMVDLGLIRSKGLIYRYFVSIEKKLYNTSDRIGYTSKANRQYLIEHGVPNDKLVAVNNSVDPNYRYEYVFRREELLKEYGVLNGQIVLFYGGNLGKPQDIEFVVRCLKTQIEYNDRFFIICGQGTEYGRLEKFINTEQPQNIKLLPFLPKQEYDQLILACDVGLVFLNHKFTVPNCPSRFYTYMEYGKPVFACTDKASDISYDIHRGKFGWWCESMNVSDFEHILNEICKIDKAALEEKGKCARRYLEENFTVDKDYKRIIDSISNIQMERIGK